MNKFFWALFGVFERSVSSASLSLSSCFLFGVQTSLIPTFRSRWSELSYNFNTDAVIFDEMGFPSLLINEHINLHQNFNRPYYHQSGDMPNHLNTEYGSRVAKLAISGIASLAK